MEKAKCFDVWDVNQNRVAYIFSVASEGGHSMGFSRNGRVIAVMDSKEGTLYNTDSGQQIRRLENSEYMNASQPMFSKSGQYVLGAIPGQIRIWSADTGKSLYSVNTGMNENRSQRLYMCQHQSLFTSDERAIAIIPTAGRHVVDVLSFAGTAKPRNLISGLAVASEVCTNSEHPQVAVRYGGSVRMWSSKDQSYSFDRSVSTWKSPFGLLKVFALCPDGKKVVTGGVGFRMPANEQIFRKEMNQSGLDIREMATGTSLRSFAAHLERDLNTNEESYKQRIESLALSPNGKYIATAGLLEPHERLGAPYVLVVLTDAVNGGVLASCKIPENTSIDSLAFHPTSLTLFAGGMNLSGGKLYTLELGDTGLTTKSVGEHTGKIVGIAIDPLGKKMATGCVHGVVKVWRLADMTLEHEIKAHSTSVNAVAFSPDGRLVASASSDGTAKLWDAGNGKELRTLAGHTASVRTMTFSVNGTRLVTAGEDQTVRMWDEESGRELLVLTGLPETAVQQVSFTPDGKTLFAGCYDGTVTLWHTE